ncbi:recombinase family protein [Streptococcus pneumoniae]|uniref:recombinase family protein n=1 Tax=Streptococcus pneumoniae TaxID=1313 RepID=UPI0010DBD0D7|nr:recombinase family protein [Streptococcus pneumoniae]MBW5013174.1 recombinase family protein [Streptococcus pneumoniae]MDG7205759.1 recombinase family protein [Streptococcus pneumoniae]MDG8490558.1 recombinase family protein [Streptococcus pneumoniae]MDG8735446.1 recombinase family protein [Streptococcus pneumoniae]MDG8741856.1 recombinase family protein [Streptococcus pneumoniae]
MEKFACMYLRLSREDGDSTESNSISNQRQIIKSYARDNDFKVVAEYVDDGFSGSNFDRPKFKEMIQDLEEKKFKTIIVKDLSRFGRDYIESGKYLQKIFPEKGIRFISVNDNYDSENADVSDTHLILPIRNFINDSYCRDISMKVKSSKEIKRKNGEFIGAFAPFGYKKDSKNKHKLVVDTEVSHIIERIFNMKIDGYSSKAIADFLNSIGCVTPSKHKENSGDNHTTGFIVKDSKWDAKMVNRIITNKVYIGVLEQGKTRKLNYKSKREVEVNEEDWIVINDSHKPIISKSIYALANKMMLRDVKQSADIPHILSGMLYCKDCGSSMVRRKVKSKNGYNIFYICSLYNNKGDCTRHSIKEDYLLDMTLFALKDYLKKYNELLSQVNKLDVSKVTFNIDFESLNSEKRKYERLRQSLYMDLEDELITSEEFERFRKNYLIKIREIEKQIATKKNILANLQEKMKNKDSLVSEIVPTDLSSLNRLTIVSFIDRIEIGENNEINYVFNNLETVNLLKTLIKEESENKSEVKKNLISINKVFGNALENKTPMKLAGGVL